MNGNISGDVLTGTISGTVKISGDLIPRGIDGYSPTIDVEPIDGGTKIIINDISGTKTATIKDGATGKTAYQYAVDSGYTGTEAEFAEKLAEEIPKALKVIVEFDGSTSELGADFPVACDVSYSQILAAHESGAVIICAFYDSYTYDEIVAPIVPYPIGSWFYTCGTGTQYRYFIRFTPDGAYANCETYGSSGDDGFSPIANVKATAEGAEITITDKSGTTKATVYNGKDGAKGDSIKGEPGADGISPTVSVSKSGKVTTVSITDKNGTKTAKINDGADGAAGSNGKDGTSATHSWNGTTLTITSASGTSSADLKGAPGKDGSNGKDGYTPVKGKDYFDGTNGKDGVSVTHSWSGTTLNVTSASGTSSANLKGETGAAGSNGKDGTSVTVKSVSESSADGGSNVVTFSDGKTLTVKNGKAGTGTAGKDGKSAYQYAVDGGFTGTESEFAKKLAAESAKALTVMVEFDGSTAENVDIPVDCAVPHSQILAAYESGAVVICSFYDSSTYDEIVTPIIAYNNDEKWFYACGTGEKYRYFVRFTPDGAYANCEPLSSGGGVTSWNDLTDRPEGVGYTFPTNPVFDGNLEGRKTFYMGSNIWFVKMSSYAPTEEECYGATFTRYTGVTTIDTSGTNIYVSDTSEQLGLPSFAVLDLGNDGAVPLIGVVKTGGTYMGEEVPAGTYYACYIYEDSATWYTKSFSVLEGKEDVHKIDPKFLPGDDVMAWREIANADTASYFNSELNVFTHTVFWYLRKALETVPKELNITYDGVFYKGLQITSVPDLGDLTGNLYYLNSLYGTSYPDTGEPFLAVVSDRAVQFLTLDTSVTGHTVKVSAYCKPLTTLPVVDLTNYIEDCHEPTEISGDFTEVYNKLCQHDTVLLRLKYAVTGATNITEDIQCVAANPIHTRWGQAYVNCFVYNNQYPMLFLFSLTLSPTTLKSATYLLNGTVNF